MRKGMITLAMAAALFVPAVVLGGMWIVPDAKMDNVSAGAGITIDLGARITGYIAYGDTDGAAGYTSPGFLTLAGGVLSDSAGSGPLIINGITIDSGRTGDTAALIIGLGNTTNGKLTFSSLKLGSAIDAGTSIGSLTIGNLTSTQSYLIIKAH
jgi:hypothetical protein